MKKHYEIINILSTIVNTLQFPDKDKNTDKYKDFHEQNGFNGLFGSICSL